MNDQRHSPAPSTNSAQTDTRFSCGEIIDVGLARMIGFTDVGALNSPACPGVSKIPIRVSDGPEAQIFSPIPVTIRDGGSIGIINGRDALATLSPNSPNRRRSILKGYIVPTQSITPARSFLPVLSNSSGKHLTTSTQPKHSDGRVSRTSLHNSTLADKHTTPYQLSNTMGVTSPHPPRVSSLTPPQFCSTQSKAQERAATQTAPQPTVNVAEGQWLSSGRSSSQTNHGSVTPADRRRSSRTTPQTQIMNKRRSANSKHPDLYRTALTNQTKRTVSERLSLTLSEDIATPVSERAASSSHDAIVVGPPASIIPTATSETVKPSPDGPRPETSWLASDLSVNTLHTSDAERADGPKDKDMTTRNANGNSSQSDGAAIVRHPPSTVGGYQSASPATRSVSSQIPRKRLPIRNVTYSQQRVRIRKTTDVGARPLSTEITQAISHGRHSLRSKLGLSGIKSLFRKGSQSSKDDDMTIKKRTDVEIVKRSLSIGKTVPPISEQEEFITTEPMKEAPKKADKRIIVTAAGSPVAAASHAIIHPTARTHTMPPARKPVPRLIGHDHPSTIRAPRESLRPQRSLPLPRPSSSASQTTTDEVAGFTRTAMTVLNSAREETDALKKERLLELGKVMVRVITNAKEAEKAMEEAKMAAIQAQLSYMETHRSMLAVREVVEEWRGAGGGGGRGGGMMS